MGLIRNLFYHTGKASATRPWTSIFIGLIIVCIGSMGFYNFQSTADPQELWVPAQSRANVEQTYFAEKFGFFFRIDTAWLTPYDNDLSVDIFKHPYLDMLYYLQEAMQTNESHLNNLNFTLDNFCYKPISGEGCLVESAMQYFHDDLDILGDYNNTQIKELATCTTPLPGETRACFDSIGTPVLQFAVFGDTTCTNEPSECDQCILDAGGMQITFLLYHNEYSLDSAEEWERQVFIRNIKSFNQALNNSYHTDMTGPMEGIDYNDELIGQIRQVVADWNATHPEEPVVPLKADYLAERSIEDNIKLESAQNTSIVIISYVIMFVYVSLAIGFLPSCVHMKFGLGAVGIFVVIGSLMAAIGLTFYGNHKLTMIAAEVVPFLILAIGVDNMFLIARAERDIPEHITSIEERIGFAMKEIGPSIFTASLCETLAFFIGLLTDVPALQNFCLVAGLGVMVDFLLQMTIFVGALAIDQRRIAQNRADLIGCCIKLSEVKPRREEFFRPKFEKYYVPALFHPLSKFAITMSAICLIIIGGMSCDKLLLGLNQNVSLVEYSDTYDYFETLFLYGEAGPPAYLVFKDVDYTNSDNLVQMNLIAAQMASLNDTVLAPVYSWVGVYQNFIQSDQVWSDTCGSKEAANLGFDEQMARFVAIKIESDCCQQYGICGEQYSLDVIFDDTGRVTTTRFRFQHQIQKTQEDYIKGLVETRRACDEYSANLTTYSSSVLSKSGSRMDVQMDVPAKRSYPRMMLDQLGITDPLMLSAEVHESEAPTAFSYSLYYVYYDQYTYIRGVLFQNIFVAVGAIIVCMQILAGLRIACIVGFCVFLTFFELMGSMWMMNVVIGGYPIEMNAVLVVNLVTSLGFGVEFCNHIGMNFMRQRGTRQERAMKAMAAMGSEVVVGIASTKFLGVLVLAFAPSTLFRLYYFRMYLFIILLGVFNGLVFLPVILSWIGPPTDEVEIIEKENNDVLMTKAQDAIDMRQKYQ